jgi:hypothetical protein
VYLVTTITPGMNAPANHATELDDIKHVDEFIDSLSEGDIKRLIGDGVNRAPPKPFKPIR